MLVLTRKINTSVMIGRDIYIDFVSVTRRDGIDPIYSVDIAVGEDIFSQELKKREKVEITDGIYMLFFGMAWRSGTSGRFGFEAPKDVHILRGELLDGPENSPLVISKSVYGGNEWLKPRMNNVVQM